MIYLIVNNVYNFWKHTNQWHCKEGYSFKYQKYVLVTYATNRNEQVDQLQWQLAELMCTILSIIRETLSKNEYVTKKYMAL